MCSSDLLIFVYSSSNFNKHKFTTQEALKLIMASIVEVNWKRFISNPVLVRVSGDSFLVNKTSQQETNFASAEVAVSEGSKTLIYIVR